MSLSEVSVVSLLYKECKNELCQNYDYKRDEVMIANWLIGTTDFPLISRPVCPIFQPSSALI